MSWQVIRELLEERIQALEPTFPTAWEGKVFQPTTGVAYQRVALLPGKPLGGIFGSEFKVETGVLQIDIFYPANRGTAAPTAKAQGVLTQFRRGLSFSEGVVTVRILTHPFMSPAPADAAWQRAVVSIPFAAEIAA